MKRILPAQRALLFASALPTLLIIGACGLKGDLVLPQPESASPTQQESQDDAWDDSTSDDDSSA